MAKKLGSPVKGDWGLFLQERHLLILDWVAEGKSFAEIAAIFSMDPVQVQLISMTPFDGQRFAREQSRPSTVGWGDKREKSD